MISYAQSLAIDFIICDHHLPGDEIPNAVAVLDPKEVIAGIRLKNFPDAGSDLSFVRV